MDEKTTPTPELAARTVRGRDELEGDYATGERTEPKDTGTEIAEGDFARGERTTGPIADPEADLHGDFAAGERTEPIEIEDEIEGTFADTEGTPS